jgi:hypothetical protein
VVIYVYLPAVDHRQHLLPKLKYMTNGNEWHKGETVQGISLPNLLRPSSLFGVLKEIILLHCWHHYNGFTQCEPKKSDIYYIQITAQCNTIVGVTLESRQGSVLHVEVNKPFFNIIPYLR